MGVFLVRATPQPRYQVIGSPARKDYEADKGYRITSIILSYGVARWGRNSADSITGELLKSLNHSNASRPQFITLPAFALAQDMRIQSQFWAPDGSAIPSIICSRVVEIARDDERRVAFNLPPQGPWIIQIP